MQLAILLIVQQLVCPLSVSIILLLLIFVSLNAVYIAMSALTLDTAQCVQNNIMLWHKVNSVLCMNIHLYVNCTN